MEDSFTDKKLLRVQKPYSRNGFNMSGFTDKKLLRVQKHCTIQRN